MRGEIKALTGVRGIAAIYVCLYHFSYLGQLGPPLARRLLGHGYLAVDLFFVLSGFVMALNYASAFRHDFTRLSYRNFMQRRIARIYPLYIVMALVCVAVAYFGGNEQWLGWWPEALNLGINASLLQSLHCGLSIDRPSWSISAEMIAYLLFPALCTVALFGGRWRAAATAVFCVLTLAALSMIPSYWLPASSRDPRQAWMDLSDGNTIYPVLRCLAEFTLGVIMWRLAAASPGHWLSRRGWPGGVLASLLLLAMFFRGDDTLIVVLFAPMILCLATDRSIVTRLMGSRLPEALGVISYSIYLVHTPVRDLLETALARMPPSHLPGGRLPVTLAEIGVVIAVASVTYRFVEKPGAEALRARFRRTLWPPRPNKALA